MKKWEGDFEQYYNVFTEDHEIYFPINPLEEYVEFGSENTHKEVTKNDAFKMVKLSNPQKQPSTNMNVISDSSSSSEQEGSEQEQIVFKKLKPKKKQQVIKTPKTVEKSTVNAPRKRGRPRKYPLPITSPPNKRTGIIGNIQKPKQPVTKKVQKAFNQINTIYNIFE